MNLLSITNVKRAQKWHVCFECGHPIEIGQPYTKWAVIIEGEFDHGQGHLDCVAWANAVMNSDDGRMALFDSDPEDEWEEDFNRAVRANPPSDIVRSRLPARWLEAVDRILNEDHGRR